MNKICFIAILCFFITLSSILSAGTLSVITEDVPTEFATYRPVMVSVTPCVTPYSVASDLSNVSMGNINIPDGSKEILVSNGFFTYPCPPRSQIYQIYKECKENGQPIFVTTDACLHTYHILYDYILRTLETDYFIDDLTDLTQVMLSTSQSVYESASEMPVIQAALDNISYFSVALGLLNPQANNFPDVVSQEITLINEGSIGYVPSPLFYQDVYPYIEDYSQYKPRGHYTRSEELGKYFKAMMWYGRITFSLNLDGASQAGLRHAARQALLITQALGSQKVGDENAEIVWKRIYEPTVFFVGKTDDITFSSYLDIATSIFGSNFLSQSPDVLADDGKIDEFIERAYKDLPDPKITVMAGKGFRFMGQRYIPDSYILDQLVNDTVSGRFIPRGLDVMAVLGSGRAYEIIDTVYHDPDLYPNYAEKIYQLKTEFSGYAPEIWAQNLYYNWLYTFSPLLTDKGAGYPLFMQSSAWTDKNLNTALGSWAELRHDTILYAKQAEGAIGDPPPLPFVKGYVEPEPEVYGRLSALADFMYQGLENRGFLTTLIAEQLERFKNLMNSLVSISVKELTNITPSTEEFLVIANIGMTLEDIVTYPPGWVRESDADKYMAVIADVFTDPMNNEALEVGVGHPLHMYVIAPVDGVLTLTHGGIFSYHEFTRSLSEGRLTDEEWQAIENSANAYDMPVWTASYVNFSSHCGTPWEFYISDQRVYAPIDAVEENSVPMAFPLLQNYPNPFNLSTLVSFTVGKSGMVKLSIFNVFGQEIEVLINRYLPAGNHQILWIPKNELASGIYFMRLTTEKNSKEIKTVFLK